MATDNTMIDDHKMYIVVPSREAVKDYKDIDEHLAILNSLESPSDRLKTLFKSLINPWSEPTHEAYHIRTVALLGGMSGLFIGGILKSPDLHQAYQRKHNAAVFEGKFVGNRHFWDTLITGAAARGMRMGFQVALLTSTAGMITFGSIAYRNKLHLPDLLLGFTALGGLTRLWLGPKAVLVGCGFGLCGGLIAFGLGKGTELVTQQSVTQMRLIHHSEWLKRRELKLRKFQKASSEETIKYMKSGEMK